MWFTTQTKYDYMPLRAGLGLVSPDAFEEYALFKQKTDPNHVTLSPKLYTTRTHPLSGEYYVVKGSRFKAEAVTPRIEFRIVNRWDAELFRGVLTGAWDLLLPSGWKDDDLFAELDLGIKGATLRDLALELARLNGLEGSTVRRRMYIHKLGPVLRQSIMDVK